MARTPLSERFWAKVESGSGEDCWNWIGSTRPTGYGKIWIPTDLDRGYTESAHRVSYEIHVGPIPRGMEIDHLCRNRRCVNPAHLEVVTHAENVRRGAAVRTHCKHGHPLSGENLTYEGGWRRCLTCRRRWNKESNARRRKTAA